MSQYVVLLAARGNPDLQQDPNQRPYGVPVDKFVECATWEEVEAKVDAYHEFLAGDESDGELGVWAGGDIWKDGTHLGRVVWDEERGYLLDPASNGPLVANGKYVSETPVESSDRRKRPLSFCVVVESHLPAEATREVLNAILDAGLADAAATLESDMDGEMMEQAQDAVDMNVHAPTLMELPRLATVPASVPAVKSALLGEGEFVTVYAEAYAADDNGDGPNLAEFVVDQAFLDRVSRLHAVCVENELTEARVYAGPDWGPFGIEDELRLQNHELVVTRSGEFWYTADVKHDDYHVESRALNITEFEEHVRSAHAQGDEYLRCGKWNENEAEERIAEYRDAKAARLPSPH